MEYTKIELKGYKRLQLNNIELIRMEPKQVIQLILGMNGSGKSSLLREITPLPSPHTQYENGGYKLLELTHRNHTYQVINRFDGKSGRYQLIRDGVDIFQGSTVTDFRSLIKDEFGITPEIQSLIDGVTRFSTMDVGKRRYWFTLLSQADYTFAFKYYSNLRSSIRDLQGSMTISQNRYAVELGRVLSDEEIVKTRERLGFLQETLHYLLESKPRVSSLKSDLERGITEQDITLEQLTKRLGQIRTGLSRFLQGPLSHVNVNADYCSEWCHRLDAQIEYERLAETEFRTRLEELHEHSSQDQHSQGLSDSELQHRYQLSRSRRLELSKGLSDQLPLNISITEFRSAFDSVYENVSEIISQLPAEGSRDITRETQTIAQQRQEGLQLALNDLQGIIQHSQRQIADMDYAKANHKRVCPNCQHEWYQGYEETRYQLIKNNLTQDIEKETQLTIDLQKNQEWLIEINRIFDLRSRLSQIIRSWPILNPLWVLLTQKGIVTPRQGQTLLEHVLRDLPILAQLEILDREIKQTEELIELAKVQSTTDYEAHQNLIQDVEMKLVLTQDKIRAYQEQRRVFEKLFEGLTLIDKIKIDLETTLNDRKNNVDQLVDSLKVEHFNRLITIVRQEVSAIEQSISKIDIQQSLLTQLKQQLSDHEDQIRLLKQAEQAMSPSTGLIAKGLTGFINWFISRMNGFVKNIWVYPLEAMPISIDDDIELDYKFPVMIDHRFKAPDIKVGETNGSTCEIFDLAFRIVAMDCLGLKAYPLQLDEFGASFDHGHRTAAFQVVTNLTVSTDVPQIFVVSHAEQSYNSLKNIDVTVLHPENIIIPGEVVVNGNTYIS